MLKVNNLPPIAAPGLDGWVNGGAILAPVANSMPLPGQPTHNTLSFADSESSSSSSSSSDSASEPSSPVSSIESEIHGLKPILPLATPSSILSNASFAPTLPCISRSASFPVQPTFSNAQTQQWPQLTRNYSTSDAFPAAPAVERHRKAKFVESLIGIAVHVIETIWVNHSSSTRTKILPLSTFITETLRRSRTSCSTLQTAMLYIFRIKDAVLTRRRAVSGTMSAAGVNPFPASMSSILCAPTDHAMCGRRMFLAALISASKFLQDRNFSNRAWAKLTGLTVAEINANELTFLKLIDYNLFVKPELYHRWNMFLSEHIHMTSHVEQSRQYASSMAQNGFASSQPMPFERSQIPTPFATPLPPRSCGQISPLATPSAQGYLMTPSTRRGSVTLSEFSLTLSDGTPSVNSLEDSEQLRSSKQGLVQRYLDMLSVPSESPAGPPGCITSKATHPQYPSPSPSPIASLRQRSASRPWVASPSSYSTVTVDGMKTFPAKSMAGRKRGVSDMSNDCQDWSKRLRES